MATTAIIPIHTGKSRPVAAALKMSVDYIKNPDKTEVGQWVTAFACDPLIADDEFLFSKNQYAAITGRSQGASDVLAYHLRIAFKPGETDAETANRIGYDLAMKLTHGNHAFVCCTHTDRQHIHTHVVVNSTSIDCTKKFRNFKGSAFTVRRIADFLCVENGLSIVENPKPSRGSYGKWQGDGKPQTNRDKLERMIDAALEKAKDFDGFIAAMIAAGCEVKQNKNLAFKIPGADRFARCKSLGEDYSEEAIRERLAGLRKVMRKPPAEELFVEFTITRQTSFSLLIDIQEKVAEGKGKAYENWAALYNLKQMARTLIYLKENGIDSYDELVQKSSAVSADYNGKSKQIRDIETRQKEISELQKHIGQYRKTREVYRLYSRQKTQKDRDDFFYAGDNATDIILHRASKNYFDEKGYGKNKPLPKMDDLKREWATLNSEKKTLYKDYNDLKAKHKNWQVAKDNCERILGIGKEEAERTAERVRQRSYSHDR